MISCVRTGTDNPDFLLLVQQLDLYLAEMDGEDHAFYDQYNQANLLRHVVVAYADGMPVGCGAIKEVAPDTVEIKRMYTVPQGRGKGIASRILAELEHWSAALGYSRCVLETGKRQTEAIALYHKNGYTIIPNYGPYAGVEYSLCFEKQIRPADPATSR